MQLPARGVATRCRIRALFLEWCPTWRKLMGIENVSAPVSTAELIEAGRWPALTDLTPVHWRVPTRGAGGRALHVLLIRLSCSYNEDIEIWVVECLPSSPGPPPIGLFLPSPSPYTYPSVFTADDITRGLFTHPVSSKRLINGQIERETSATDNKPHVY